MTAIVGLVHNGAVWLAGDRCVSTGCLTVSSDRPKVWRLGEMVIGAAGETSWMSAVEYLTEATPIVATDEPHRYLSTVFVPAIRRAASDYGRAGKNGDGTEAFDGALLLGLRGKLYWLNGASMGVVPLAESFGAIGCAKDIARGALAALTDWSETSPAERLTSTLGYCAEFDGHVRGPFDVVTTADEAPR